MHVSHVASYVVVVQLTLQWFNPCVLSTDIPLGRRQLIDRLSTMARITAICHLPCKRNGSRHRTKGPLIANVLGILVSAPDLPPLLHSHLFASVSSLLLTRRHQTAALELTKAAPGAWAVVVTAELPGMGPRSSYFVRLLLSQAGDQQL
jgi:hypothetical protein